MSSGSLFAPFFRTCSLIDLLAALLAASTTFPAACADIWNEIGGSAPVVAGNVV